MSPKEMISRLKEKGITWMAITDHNSMANCPAYESVAREAGIAFTWGMELQTAEEIHLLVYFDDSAHAQEFDRQVYESLLPIPNDPDFFGDQVIIDENENIIGMEQRALVNSSLWDLETAVNTAVAHNGYCVPAHIDAQANSIIGQLGFIPATPSFDLLGITAGLDLACYLEKHPELQGRSFLRCSDAHYLSDIGSGFSRVHVQAPTASELIFAARGGSERSIIV